MREGIAGEREMVIAGITVVGQHSAQVLLREAGGGRVCALRCDLITAIGMDQVRLGSVPQQMHVQELVRRVMQETHTRLIGILLVSGTGDIITGRLFLRQDDREFTIDCRAADAIAQAQRWKLPIMMDEILLQDAHEKALGIPSGLGPPAGNA